MEVIINLNTIIHKSFSYMLKRDSSLIVSDFALKMKIL